MKKNYNFLVFMLLFIFCLSLFACSDNEKNVDNGQEQIQQSEKQENKGTEQNEDTTIYTVTKEQWFDIFGCVKNETDEFANYNFFTYDKTHCFSVSQEYFSNETNEKIEGGCYVLFNTNKVYLRCGDERSKLKNGAYRFHGQMKEEYYLYNNDLVKTFKDGVWGDEHLPIGGESYDSLFGQCILVILNAYFITDYEIFTYNSLDKSYISVIDEGKTAIYALDNKGEKQILQYVRVPKMELKIKFKNGELTQIVCKTSGENDYSIGIINFENVPEIILPE